MARSASLVLQHSMTPALSQPKTFTVNLSDSNDPLSIQLDAAGSARKIKMGAISGDRR